MLRGFVVAFALGVIALAGCSGEQSATSAIAEVQSRVNQYPDYPQAGRTYLSFSSAHGFQVNYLADATAWLWYPGNSVGVPEEWKRDTVSGQAAICWRRPKNSYNPVTKTQGGPWGCQALDLSQKQIVADLVGDPFNLRSGQVPYRLSRCEAPAEFSFDRNRFSC